MTPEKLLYAKTHEWVALSNDGGQKVATIGLTAFAVEALTDLVFIELPKVGAQVTYMKPMGVVESVKAASDIFAPLSGKVVAVNDALLKTPESVNQDCYGKGWMVKIKMSSKGDHDKLMAPDAYEKQIATQGH